MAFCRHCGAELIPGAPYCIICKMPAPSQKTRIAPIILGVVGLVFSLLMPVVTYCCSIIGLILAVQERGKGRRSIEGLVLNLVALGLAGIATVLFLFAIRGAAVL